MKHMFTDCRLKLGFIIVQNVQHIYKHLVSTVSSMRDSLAIFSLVILLTADGKNPAPVEVGNLSHYLQGFTHCRRCVISSISSIDMGLINSVLCYLTASLRCRLSWGRTWKLHIFRNFRNCKIHQPEKQGVKQLSLVEKNTQFKKTCKS